MTATILLAISSRSAMPAQSPDLNDRGDGFWPLLPYVPVLLSFVTAAFLQLRDGTLGAVLVWVLLCTALLVLVRQFLNLRTHQDLLKVLDEQRIRLSYQAHHDPLTGLANRAMLSEYAAERADASADTITAVIILDLDGFKSVNDTLGHAAGDELLVIAAARLLACVRSVDLVVRLGGDEFVVFMPALSEIQEAEQVSDRILRSLGEPVSIGEALVPIRASIGVAIARGGLGDPDHLMRDADAALYAAKGAGKNQVRLFAPPPVHQRH